MKQTIESMELIRLNDEKRKLLQLLEEKKKQEQLRHEIDDLKKQLYPGFFQRWKR